MPRSVHKEMGRGPLADHELMAAVTRVARRNRRAGPDDDDWDRELWMSYVDPANDSRDESRTASGGRR